MVISTEIGFDCEECIYGYQSLETKTTSDTKSENSENKNKDAVLEKDCSDERKNGDVIDDEASVGNEEVPSDNKSEKLEVENKEVFVVVTFPPTLGRFEDNIEFGSIGAYAKTLCKNPGDISKVKETEPKCGVENNSPEVILDDLKDEKDDNVTFQIVEENGEEISKMKTKPNCDMICDGVDDKNADKISFQGVEEIDDVKSAAIPVVDDGTKETELKCGVKNNTSEVIRDDLQDEDNDNVTFQIVEENVEEISNLKTEPNCVIICDDLDDKNAEKISFQGVEEIDDVKRVAIPVIDDETKETELKCGVKNNCSEVIRDDLEDEKNDDVTFQLVEENVEQILNLKTEPDCNIICDDLDDKNANKNSFQEVEEIDDAKRVEIPVIDDETKEDEMSRLEDERLNEQINYAELQLDEKTRYRDAIRDEIQREKAKLKADNEVLNAANLEIKAAKQLVSSKRQEIDYVQCVVNKIKNSVSVEDINSKIYEVDRMIEYEPLWLKDENQFIREIKQLKSICECLASNMGSQDEIHLALLQKDKFEALLKNLRKEMKSIRDKVSKAEVSARAIRKTYDGKIEKGKELHAKFRAADELRQEAYGNISSLKKLLYNKDTLDQPLCVLPNEVNSVPAVSEVETEKSIPRVEEKHSDDQDWAKVERKNNQEMKRREPGSEVIENKGKEKTYELKKKETESINMKANEAMEVKKRNAENTQMQTEMQIQKEVEKKEKAMLKRLRKKEKKKAGSSNNIDIVESNEIKNTTENRQQHSPPNFLPKQVKRKIFPQLASQNQKWLQQHWRKMVNFTAIVILAALSLRNIYLSI